MIRFHYQGQGYYNIDLSTYEQAFLHNLYYAMLRIRRIEEEIERRYCEDEMKTPIHLVIGQEATSVGSCAALKTDDRIYATHRTHGNYLAKGGDLKAMISELYCRANGCVASRGGSMHLLDKKAGMDGSSAIVGGIIPIATGSALAAQLQSSDCITGVFFGDGATEEGALWESLNFAALKKLPVIYFCENNFYSVCSPLKNREPAGTRIDKKADAFGVNAEQVDATNVIKVYEATLRAILRINSGAGPAFLECIAYRWRGHSGAGDDSHTGYRDPKEVLHWETVCPVATFYNALIDQGLLHENQARRMEEMINAEIKEAFAYAINSPNPVYEDLNKFAYSD
ncbi:MAG: acetoin:2,6-dichlorophenolindophenol oxidoreductase subunit alpha [Candidatus Parabeggiatoa sp. nov. 2]|nr:MAG: acetoin:2,6-dichlorophenolindophenol oxidoreductase subunit alpha [Beggiatoa sp. 4572_84]